MKYIYIKLLCTYNGIIAYYLQRNSLMNSLNEEVFLPLLFLINLDNKDILIMLAKMMN